MDDEIQGRPITLAQYDEAQRNRAKATHLELDLEL